MITVTFDKKLTEQFENYGEVLKWISDQLSSNSAGDNSDNRVKLELLTKEEIQFLADDQDGIWADVLDEYSNFDYIVYYDAFDFDFVYVIKNINSCAYDAVLECLEACDISELFYITED